MVSVHESNRFNVVSQQYITIVVAISAVLFCYESNPDCKSTSKYMYHAADSHDTHQITIYRH